MATRAQETTRLLQGIIQGIRDDLNNPARIQPQSIAPYSTAPGTPIDTPSAGKQNPSLVSRIFDVLSRPLYGVTGAIQASDESQRQGQTGWESLGDVAKGFGRGVAGKDKFLFSDILESRGMESNAALGFAGDVLLDPLTYAGGAGLFAKLGAGGRQIQKSQGALRDITKSTERQTEELISRATGVNPGQVAEAQSVARGMFTKPVAKSEPKVAAGIEQVTPVKTQLPRVELPGLPNLRRESAEQTLRQPTIAVPENLRGLPIEEALPKLLQRQQRGTRGLQQDLPRDIPLQPTLGDTAAVAGANLMAGRLATKPMAKTTPSPETVRASEEAAQRFLQKNKHKTINELGQSDLIQVAVSGTGKGSAPHRYNSAFQRLREMERSLENAGRTFAVAGKTIRPSEILNEIGRNNFTNFFRGGEGRGSGWAQAIKAFATGNISEIKNPRMKTAFKDVFEQRSALQAKVSDKAMEEAIRRGKELDNSAVAARAKQNKETLVGALGDLKKEAGTARGAGLGAEKNFLRKILEPDVSAPLSIIQSEARALFKKSVDGKSSVDAVLNKATYESLGGKPKILGQIIGNNRAGEAIMTRFATWWGARDLKPFQREALDTARIGAQAFASAWAPIVRGLPAEGRQAAFRAAQGGLQPANKLEARAAQQFQDAMEKLFHSADLSDSAAAGNTVALRAGLGMDELNEALKSAGTKFQFTDASKVSNKYGETFDFSNNADWLKSWQVADVEDPVELMYRMHLGLQRVTRQNSMVDDLAARWGTVTKTGDFNTKINHPRLQGYYFPSEIAEQSNVLFKQLFDPGTYKSPNEMMKLYDKSLGAFKSGVTVYSPSHHIRNAIGDIWLSAVDGVVTPAPYFNAARVLRSQERRYRGMEGVMEITDPDALKRAMTRPGDTILTTKGGQQLTADQIYTAAFNQGILLRAPVAEDIMQAGGRLIGDLPITQGRVREAAYGVAELRDHYVRLAHFNHVLKSSKTKNLEDLFKEAGMRVKRYHPDGMDMTEFETKVMRRLIPFYSWMRKSTPLIIEAMVQRPGLVTAYPKAMLEIQNQFGIEPTSGLGDPFPVDQMFPEWIRTSGVGPIGAPGGFLSGLARGEGYAMLNPSTPFNDSVGDMSNPMQYLKSSLTPHISLPASIYSGADPLGIPLENAKLGPVAGTPAYVAQQILPPLGTASRVSGATRPEESFSPEQLIRWLTASGLIGTGPYRKQAVFENQEALNNG